MEMRQLFSYLHIMLKKKKEIQENFDERDKKSKDNLPA
jgi:hypothetical protein